MNYKFLFAKIAALMVLAFGLFVAGELIQKRVNQPLLPPPVAAAVQTPQISPPPAPQPPAKPVKLEKHAPFLTPPPNGAAQPAAQDTPDDEAPVADPAPTPVEPPTPRHMRIIPNSVTVAFAIRDLPGQEVHVDNCCFSYVRLDSDFPIAVHAGQCQATNTTDIICHITANIDVNFQDLRIGVPIDSAPLNLVRLTAIRDDPDN
jgi:hypothetical protein